MMTLIMRLHLNSRLFCASWLLTVVVFFSAVGCGTPTPTAMAPLPPPAEFSEDDAVWMRVQDGPSNSDNQRIGEFFKKHPSLVGSPDWTGQPEKYLCKKSSSSVRFYWFNGPGNALTWTALEFQGNRVRNFDGVGLPGSLHETTNQIQTKR